MTSEGLQKPSRSFRKQANTLQECSGFPRGRSAKGNMRSGLGHNRLGPCAPPSDCPAPARAPGRRRAKRPASHDGSVGQRLDKHKEGREADQRDGAHQPARLLRLDRGREQLH